jgi:BlaI family penicillinase repressor
MNALWQEHPATAREIADRLPPETDWSYSTIKTMLRRLTEKGAVSEHKRSNLSFFGPVLSKRKARMAALASIADDAFDGAFGSLMHFLLEQETLTPAQRRKLIERLKTGARKGGDK